MCLMCIFWLPKSFLLIISRSYEATCQCVCDTCCQCWKSGLGVAWIMQSKMLSMMLFVCLFTHLSFSLANCLFSLSLPLRINHDIRNVLFCQHFSSFYWQERSTTRFSNSPFPFTSCYLLRSLQPSFWHHDTTGQHDKHARDMITILSLNLPAIPYNERLKFIKKKEKVDKPFKTTNEGERWDHPAGAENFCASQLLDPSILTPPGSINLTLLFLFYLTHSHSTCLIGTLSCFRDLASVFRFQMLTCVLAVEKRVRRISKGRRRRKGMSVERTSPHTNHDNKVCTQISKS